MHVSEQFRKVIAASLMAIFIVTAALFVAECINPQSRTSAQNSGIVGIYTREFTVFTAVSSGTGKTSGIFPDYGFAQQSLFVCNSGGFSGSIDLEWSPTGTGGTYYPVLKANYSNDSQCHTLQLGGYFPNLRSTMTRTAGSLSAWYTASAAPISFFPAATGSNGGSSPFQCDQFQTSTVITSGGFTALAITSGRGLAVCAFTISFGGATSVQTDGVQVGYGATCSGGVFPWFITTTASTPQTLQVGSGLGAIFQTPVAVSNICVGNHSGASLKIAISYAVI